MTQLVAERWTVEDDFGLGVLKAIVTYTTWCHRKVQSWRFLDGPNNLERVSFDATIPDDDRLKLRFATTQAVTPGQLFVPLSMLKKVVARSFDASLGNSEELRIADSELNGSALVEAIVASTRIDLGAEPSSEYKKAVRGIVCGTRSATTTRRARNLVNQGVFNHSRVIEPKSLGIITRRLILDSADNYLLAALVPSRYAGAQEVMKYSAHWNPAGVASTFQPFSRLAIATGHKSAQMRLQIASSILVPRSYHLEFHAPSGLNCAGLEVLSRGYDASRTPRIRHVAADLHCGPVAHVVVKAKDVEDPKSLFGVLRLHLAPTALLTTSMLAGWFTTTALWAAFFVPGVMENLFSGVPSPAAATYLAVPAVLIAAVSRSTENPLVSRLLAPLRFLVLGFVGILLVAAGSIAGGVTIDVVMIPWQIAGYAAGVVTLFVTVGFFRCRSLRVTIKRHR